MAQTGISIWKYPNMRGPNRGDRPGILFEINPRADRLDKTPVPLWYQDGTLVLDQDNSPVRAFDLISAVCSSQIEGWLMVAILHTDNRLRIGVIRARIHEAMEGIHASGHGGRCSGVFGYWLWRPFDSCNYNEDNPLRSSRTFCARKSRVVSRY